MAECRQKPVVSTGKQLLPFSTTSPRMFTLIWAREEKLVGNGRQGPSRPSPQVGHTRSPGARAMLGVGRKGDLFLPLVSTQANRR